jgi:hypothetical protein
VARPTKKIEIPMRCKGGILDLKEKGWSDSKIGVYFGVSQNVISKRIREYKNSKTP